MNNQNQKQFPDLGRCSLLFGHLPEMQRDTYEFYRHYHKQYGEYLRFKALPGIPFYSLASPDALHHILVTARDKYSRGARWSGLVGYLGGNGLVTSSGEHWQKQRQHMNPYFGSEKLDAYTSVIVNNTMALVRQWQQLPENTEINITDIMMYLGLINISDILFGYNIRSDAQSFSTAMVDGFAYVDRFIKNPFTIPKNFPTRTNRHFKKQMAIADHIAHKIINAARQDERDSVVRALIKAGNCDMEMRDEIVTLLMAGHDTTATALAWGWSVLAQSPEILANIQDELKEVLKGEPPTSETFLKLTYTNMVFREILRLYPSVWAIHRFCEEEDEVQGFPVQKGCSIALPVYVTHRHPEYWQHPENFHPEHFLKAASAERPRFAYVPFGAGEHVCLGARLATMEGILILATLLQHFTPTLKSNDPVKLIIAFTLKPEHDLIGVKRARTR